MKVMKLASTILVCLIICGEKFRFLWQTGEGKKYIEKGMEEF